jgi:hypothetical protein
MPRDRRYGGRTSIRDVDLYEGGYTPWERAGQAALSRTPEAFSYGSLEEKYPTRQVMPMVPSYIQNQIDEENLIRKSNEVALRIREAQLNTYDSKLNEDKAIAEQVIQARPEFAALNPQDPDYQEKRDQLLIKYPMIEDSKEFMARTVGRLDRINERYINKIKPPTSGDPYKDYEDAYKAVTALRTAKPDKKTEYTKEDEIFESLQVQKMDQAMARMGGAMQPSTQQQPALAPTVEDADIITARKLISRKPELKEEVNRRLISAGKPPIE